MTYQSSARDIAQEAIERRAIEAAIWGMPIVSVDAMREAFFRDAGAKYGDVVFWSQPSDWKFQFTTPNASTRYVYFNFNLKDGAVVFEIPAAVDAGLFGSIVDAWQVPVADVGPEGEDKGKGGKYLLLPPSDTLAVPPGYIPIQFQTVNGYALLRAISKTSTEADVAKAIGLVKQMRVYPLAAAGAPPPQRYIDMAGKLMDGAVKFDDTFYQRLARMVNEEPILRRDFVAMGQLVTLGIEKGRDYLPDASLKPILSRAAESAHTRFMREVQGGDPWWPDLHWNLVEHVGAKTGFTFETDHALFVDERARVFFLAFAAPKKLGGATMYLVGANDAGGTPLQGDRTYRLRVPPNVPAKQYWAVTLYDLDTCCLIPKMSRPGIDSYDQKMTRNADGSVDLFFGPKPPAGKDANWVETAPGRPWLTLFRFYGPDKPLFEKTWRLTDFEHVANG